MADDIAADQNARLRDKEWLSPSEVAFLIERHLVTVRRLLESGELHGHQRVFGGRWSVHRAAVDAWRRGLPGKRACGCSLRSVA